MVVTARAPATLCAEVVAAAPRHGGHPPGRMLMACVTLAFLVIFAPFAARQANAAFLVQIDVEAPLISGTQPAGIFTFSAIADFDPFTTNDSSAARRSFLQINMTVGGQSFVVPKPRFFYTSGESLAGEGNAGFMQIGGAPNLTSLAVNENDFTLGLGGFFDSGEQQLLQPGISSGVVGLDGGQNRSILLEGATVSASIVPLPAALPLFATGLAGFGWLVRRRRRAADER